MIQVTSPPHAPGPVGLRVVNPDGQSCTLDPGEPYFSFIYETDEPSINLGGVYPLAGPTEGGQEVVIGGERFRPGVRVEFGGFPAQVISATNFILSAITPPHPPGPVVVRVINPTGLSCTYEGDWVFGPYTFSGSAPGAPLVQQADPPQGSLSGGETVTVRGQNFFAGIRVFFGTRECTNVVRTSSQVLTLTTPPSALGAVDVRVRNADEQTGLLTGGFAYVPPLPVITGLSTHAGPTAGGVSVTLFGSGFMLESDVLVGGNRALSVTFLSATNLSFTTPPGFPGLADITVVNAENRVAELTDAFTYQGAHAPAPVLDAVLPNAADPAGGTTVVIRGRNFLAGVSVTIGGQPLGQLQLQSPTTVTGLTPPHVPGVYDVVLSNADGQSISWPTAISYFASHASPSITLQPQSLVVSSGSNAVFHVTAVGLPPLGFQWHFNGGPIPGATSPMLSLTGVKVTQAGNYTVVVTNPNGSVTSQVALLSVAGPLTRPAIRITRESSGQLSLRVEAEDAAPLALQRSTNLVDWMAIGDVAANAWQPLDTIYPAWTNNSPTLFRAARTSPTNVPPTLASQPQSQTVFVGENAIFGVTATGTPPLSYQWRHNDADLSNGANVTGATSALLTLSNVRTSDAGTFQVVVTNAVGSVTSAPVTLTVQVPAVPPQSPLNLRARRYRRVLT